jgi:hypothetical protein
MCACMMHVTTAGGPHHSIIQGLQRHACGRRVQGLFWPPPNLGVALVSRKRIRTYVTSWQVTSACHGTQVAGSSPSRGRGDRTSCRYWYQLRARRLVVVGRGLRVHLYTSKYYSWSLSQKYSRMHVTWSIKEQKHNLYIIVLKTGPVSKPVRWLA